MCNASVVNIYITLFIFYSNFTCNALWLFLFNTNHRIPTFIFEGRYFFFFLKEMIIVGCSSLLA